MFHDRINISEHSLRSSHLALKRGYELSILREDGEVEVVVVVRNRDLPRPVDPNSDRVVRDPWVFFRQFIIGKMGAIELRSNFISCFLVVVVVQYLLLTFAANLPKEVALIVEDLDAVSAVVTDEDLLTVVDDDPVGELEVLRAAKLVQHVAQLVEDDHPHHLDKKG